MNIINKEKLEGTYLCNANLLSLFPKDLLCGSWMSERVANFILNELKNTGNAVPIAIGMMSIFKEMQHEICLLQPFDESGNKSNRKFQYDGKLSKS